MVYCLIRTTESGRLVVFYGHTDDVEHYELSFHPEGLRLVKETTVEQTGLVHTKYHVPDRQTYLPEPPYVVGVGPKMDKTTRPYHYGRTGKEEGRPDS